MHGLFKIRSRVFGVSARRELLGRHLEAALGARRDDHGLGFGEPHHVGIRHPVRRDDDRFVAGVEQREARVVAGLLRARGDEHLLRRVAQAVVALELRDDGLLEQPRAVDGRVLRVVARERGRGRGLDVLRRREVRLADGEHDDVAALLAQPLRARRDADRGGRANALQPLRELDGQTGDLFLGGRGYLKMHALGAPTGAAYSMTDRPLQLVADFAPAGDQPQAIAQLVDGLQNGLAKQTLLGVTGRARRSRMASVISTVQRPTLILAHNKTLAAQLYGEMREFFPHNAVEYFVSYYDYYQPEAYVPSSDTYIEKDASINSHIEQMRLSATKAVLERRDVVIVATVSAIYGLGDPEAYHGMVLHLARGSPLNQRDLLRRLDGAPVRAQSARSRAAAPIACAATSSTSFPPNRRRTPCASSCSTTRSSRSASSIR